MFSSLKPSTRKAAKSIITIRAGIKALIRSQTNAASQYELAWTPLTNWRCFAYNDVKWQLGDN